MKKIIEKLDVYLNNIKIKKKIFLLYFYCIIGVCETPKAA